AERRILSRPETIRRGKSLWPMNISEWHGRCSTRTWVRNNNKGAYSAIRECGGLFSRRCHGSDAARRGRYLATRDARCPTRKHSPARSHEAAAARLCGTERPELYHHPEGPRRAGRS